MSEERLQEIKDSINLQYKVQEANDLYNFNIFTNEEQELYDEVIRLHTIIKEVREYIENNTEEKKSWLNGIPDYRVFKGDTKELLEILDKENI